ncbi:MAG: response regulator transcription factor [Hyphomicrobium sp.]|nr:response regulator transcription factor [Hyphomicrobium sp.]
MKVLIVDDHAVLREGVRRLLSAIPGIEFLEATTAADALAQFRKHSPHVTILDVNLEGSSGIELLQRLRNESKTARIVMFTMHSEQSYALRAIRAGAMGYVSKSAPLDELLVAVKRVAAGERYLDRNLARDLAFSPAAADDPFSKLSNREIEILRLLGEGKSLSQIAATFGIAYKTVANSCSRLKTKLGLERTTDLIRVSLESRNR